MNKFDYSYFLDSLQIIDMIMKGDGGMIEQRGLQRKVNVLNMTVDFNRPQPMSKVLSTKEIN